jgi:ATP-binding cassette subfamily B protein
MSSNDDEHENEEIDYNKPLSIKVWKKMLPFIVPEKKSLIRCAMYMLPLALTDMILPLILGHVIRHNIIPRTTDGIGLVLLITVLLLVGQGWLVKLFVALGIRVETEISRKIRNSVFFHLQKLGLSYYNKTPVGYMMARTNSDTGRIGDLVAWGIIDFTWSVVYCVAIMIAMFVIHWQMALIVCLTIPPLAFLTWFFQKRILVVNRLLRKINSKMTGAMNEGITGSRTVKTLVAEKQSLF